MYILVVHKSENQVKFFKGCFCNLLEDLLQPVSIVSCVANHLWVMLNYLPPSGKPGIGDYFFYA